MLSSSLCSGLAQNLEEVEEAFQALFLMLSFGEQGFLINLEAVFKYEMLCSEKRVPIKLVGSSAVGMSLQVAGDCSKK